tara:strand:- start:3856 stop:3969 length:114 start_codon:yes stop_codon:yes gene_type:complete
VGVFLRVEGEIVMLQFANQPIYRYSIASQEKLKSFIK